MQKPPASFGRIHRHRQPCEWAGDAVHAVQVWEGGFVSTLTNDIARCPGSDEHLCCQNCRRREPGGGEHQVYMMREPKKDGDCDDKIERESVKNTKNS
jgi:hypothetical protein